MLTSRQIEGFWQVVPCIMDIVPGLILGLTDREEIKEVITSKGFEVPMFQAGMKVTAWGDRGSAKAMRTGEIQTETINTIIFGVDMVVRSIPFVDDEGQIAGSLTVGSVHYHPVTRAFPSFAPMIADMFPEGAMLYMTDLEKVTSIQGSSRFTLQELKVEDKVVDGSTEAEAIRNQKMVARELPASQYGLPLLSVSYPLLDEEDTHKVMGTFNIVTPKEAEHELRDMAGNLTKNLEEMAAVVQELAASASEVMTNEQNLNRSVHDISGLINEINEILQFIRQIADETKMLGLNAAIEAARAGEAGRGFSVVAGEIRKLSDESKETVSRIREITSHIENSIAQTVNNSNLNMKSSEEQAAATQEITASIEEITAMAQLLERIAREKL